MPQLIDIDLPSRVGEKFNVFGTLLLRDDYGNKMENIAEDYRGKSERITIAVLRVWLQGKGVEVSWECLIATLRKSKLELMADQVQMALEKLRSWSILYPYINFFVHMPRQLTVAWKTNNLQLKTQILFCHRFFVHRNLFEIKCLWFFAL